MPKVTFLQTNFTAGEISPKCYGRVDVARYQNGAESLENMLTTIEGGAFGRYGSSYQASAKHNDKSCRLIPFIYSTSQSYICEFGHQYVRFYTRGGGQIMNGNVPFEIETPYTEDMLRDLDYTQGADTMLLFHPKAPIQSLKRLDTGVFTFHSATFTTIPFEETGHRFNASITISDITAGSGKTFTASSSIFLPADVGRRLTYKSGLANITGFTSSTVVTCEIITTFPSTTVTANDWTLEDTPQTTLTPSAKDPVGASITLTAGTDAFRSVDVGKHIDINGGMVKVTGITNAKTLTATITTAMSSVVASPANAWVLKGDAWSEMLGYPGTGAFFEQRLVVAGSKKYPQTLWGSKTGLYFDFTLGTNDDDGFSFTLPSTGQINPISRVASSSSLLMLTYGGEYTAQGGVEKPLTPTNPQLKPRTKYGCNNVKPVHIGNELFFVTRSGKKVRAMSYQHSSDSFPAPNVTTLAEHVIGSGIVDMAYQQEPDSRLWCVLLDGGMAALTVDRDEGVISWSPQKTNGSYESVASIPNDGGDEVWVSVKRKINGVDTRYIERFDDSLKTDAAIYGKDSTAKIIWTGLDHLEGEIVAVKTDQTYLGKYTVTNGQIEVSRAVSQIEIGLPYTSTIKTLTPEVQAGDMTSQGNAMMTSHVSLLLYKSIGGKINGKTITQRKFGSELLDKTLVPFSGLLGIGVTGWEKGSAPLTITQDEPLPFHVLSIIRKFTVNS